jgi:DNA polymerase-3 subunit epsilon
MNFVAIDFETAQYSRESAISVGLAKYSGGRLVDSWYSLIRPPKLYILPDFTNIHGLTTADVKDAPFFDEVWKKGIRPFIGDLPLAAHSASFDMDVLCTALKWYGLPVPRYRCFCSLALARAAWPKLPSHSLTSLGKHFKIVYEAHNALADAETCGKIVHLAAERLGAHTAEALLAKAGVGYEVLPQNKDIAK